MKPKRLPLFLFAALLSSEVPSTQAANGTWTNTAGGSWTNVLNWSNGIVADGAGNNAAFDSVSLPVDITITLDGPRSIGSLNFGDQSPTAHNWFLNPGSAGPLTLAGTAPAITVLNATTTFSVPLAGSAGLTKVGSGKLVLNGPASYSGATTVSAGALALSTRTFSAASPLNIAGAAGVVESAGTLNLSVNASSTALDINGPGTLRLTATTNSAAFPDLYFGPDHSGNTCWGSRLAAKLDLGSTQRFIYGKTGHNGVGPYGLTGADCQFAAPIIGSGGLTIIAQNNWTGSGPMETAFALITANTFTGPLEIRRGSVYLGNPNALAQGNVLTFNPATGQNARLFLYGNNATVSDLSSVDAGSALIANGNLKSGSILTLGAVTLDITQTTDGAFNGTITDAYPEYPAPGSGTTGPLSVTKAGPALLRLTGVSSYTGNTLVNSGVLQVDGQLGSTSLTVQSNAVLSGVGEINGPVSVQAAATLAPGNSGIGNLTINSSLTLEGTTFMKLSKTGTTLANDHIVGISALTYGGVLNITNVGDIRTGALGAGESFTLFTAGTYTGSFSDLILPQLAGDLTWDTSNLPIDGSITVVGASAPPLITRQPQGLTVTDGNPASFTVVAAGPRPLSYQWQRDGASIPLATSAAYTIAKSGSNDTAGFSVVVTNLYGSVTSLVAMLTVTPAGIATPVTNGLMVYLNFDNNISGQTGTTNHGTLYAGGATNGPRYRPGVIGSAATFANTATAGQPNDWAISLGNLEWIYSSSFTVSLWERSAISGDGALIGNKDWSSGANIGWVISTLDTKNANWNGAGGTRRDIDLNPPFSDGDWHLITVTFDRAANRVISYVDGLSVNTSDISPSGAASFNAGFSTLIGSSGNGPYAGTGDIDDLGIWRRVLSPAEISGIYGAGLSGRPLTLAVPGQAPIITAQPVNLSVTPGLSASFTVATTGPGPFTYQWRFNGTNIAGATNATLVIPAVTAASQGIYTVLVSNGSGAAISSGALLTVYELAVTGQWDFDNGDLRASVGADLEYRGDTASATAFPLLNLGGQSAGVMAFGAYSPSQGFYMRHGALPNGGGKFVNLYTLILDVMFPAQSSDHWRALFQTDPFNHDGNEAEFYVGDASSMPTSNGIGAEGQYYGTLAPDTWYRLAFAVNLAAPDGQQLSTYVNGVRVGTQSLSGGIDGRYALGPTASLFTSGTAGFTQPGFLNSLQFVNGWMPPEAIAALGAATAAGLPAGNAALKIESISADASILTLAWTGPDGQYQLQKSNGLTSPVWQDIATLTNTRAVRLLVSEGAAFYRVRQFQPDIRVGQLPAGAQSIPSKQLLRSAGQQLQFSGRPVDLALSPDGQTVYIKNMNSLLAVDAHSWRLLQALNYPANGASMHGIAVSSDGSRVYVTGSVNELYEWRVATNRNVSFSRTISLPPNSDPCGLALSADSSKAYVCLGVNNTLAEVDLPSGTLLRQIRVGVAPWDVVLSPDGTRAYVSDWGGRVPQPGDPTGTSAGTLVVIDHRGVGASGVVSCVDLASGFETAQVPAGLHASDLALSTDGTALYVANANSDTVTVINTQTRTVKETILVRPDSSFPCGSAADALALSKDGTTLFVASAGNNAVAVIELPNAGHTKSILQGFLPTDWYPGALAADADHLYVVNVKGLGSRQGQPANTSWLIGAFLGTANKVPIPTPDSLSKYTAQVFEDGRIREIRQAYQPPEPGQPSVPVPFHPGEPSVFRHVLYILKENKTYDQMFGDLPQGNGAPNLCIYPRLISPNHHALAEQYVLLDNFYCNGVNSADGHSWSTEGNDTDHLEKSFGGFSRSYSYGDDALTYSASGFIWNNVLEHGLTFRNYGEMDYASTSPEASWLQIYSDYTNHTHAIRYVQNIGIASLRPYSSTNVPGWNVGIPDVVRAEGFIKELNQAQARGSWESLHLLYLPNDHTGGPPTPRAQVADNDLALGQVVEAVTKSIFATNTVIFVIEDDPQSGYDHVDGHRSLCLVISPYTKRRQVISTFYSQAGVLHTMERILGLRPMNQQDAMAPLMFECFTNVPDFTPYAHLPNNVVLTEGVIPAKSALTPRDRHWAKKLKNMDFSRPDRINDDAFNRYIWYANKGNSPYPAQFAGTHGKGLKPLGLVLERADKAKDDD